MSSNNLVYLAFGDETYLLEAKYSILSAFSFLSNLEDLKVTLFTDNPDYFRGLEIETVKKTLQDLESLKGPFNYFARPKLVLLKNTLESKKGKAIFIDTDTYFTSSPLVLFSAITDSSFVLHKNEGDLFSLHKVFSDRIEKRYPSLEIPVPNDKPIKLVSGECPYWNSGVIGISYGQVQSLDRAIRIIDQLDPKEFGPTIEQLFLGLVFQENGGISASDSSVVHYWDKWERKGYSPRSWTHSEIRRILKLIEGLEFSDQLRIIKSEMIAPMPETLSERILKHVKALISC